MFESLEMVASDPILELSRLAQKDSNPNKIDLSAGVYKNEQGVTPIMRAVSKASGNLLALEDTKSYISISGWERFNQQQTSLLFGESYTDRKHVAVTQTVGGTAASSRVRGERIPLF